MSLFEEWSWERERERRQREFSIWLVHLPDGHIGSGWTRTKPRARNCLVFTRSIQWPKSPRLSSAAFQDTLAWSWISNGAVRTQAGTHLGSVYYKWELNTQWHKTSSWILKYSTVLFIIIITIEGVQLYKPERHVYLYWWLFCAFSKYIFTDHSLCIRSLK